MFISKEIAEKVRVKRAKLCLNKTDLSKTLNVTRGTLIKVERGDYDAPKRIYQSVMSWLTEDL